MKTWPGYALLGAAVIVPVLLTGWKPWELVALAAVLAAAGVLVVAVQAWQAVHTRAIELTALTSDEQAARLLGEALRRLGPFLSEPASREIWDTFAALPPEAKRALALAIVGLVGDAEQIELISAAPKLMSITRSFGAAVEAP